MNQETRESRVDGVDPAALLGVALAGALSTTVGDGSYTLGSAAIGITLLLLLHTFDTKSDTDVYKQSGSRRYLSSSFWTFGAVWALCFMLVIAPGIEWLNGNYGAKESSVDPSYLPLWLLFTVLVSIYRFYFYSDTQKDNQKLTKHPVTRCPNRDGW
jgi:hypothetical protein